MGGLALFAGCCTSTKIAEESSHEEQCAVSVSVNFFPYTHQAGTGVIVRSDKTGIWVLTNAHVLEIPRVSPFVGGVFTGVVDVGLYDGKHVQMTVVTLSATHTQQDGKEVWTDMCLLWGPRTVDTDASIEDSEDVEIDERILVATFEPEKTPGVITGSRSKSEKYAYILSVDQEIQFGNSGSGVYHDGRLVGLLWGKSPDGKTGSYSSIVLIREILQNEGLDWVLD